MKKVILFKPAVSSDPASVSGLIEQILRIALKQKHETIEFAKKNNLILKTGIKIDHEYHPPKEWKTTMKPMSMGYGQIYTEIDDSNPLLTEILIKFGSKVTVEDIK